MVKRLRRNMDIMDTMDGNTCLPAVHTVHIVHTVHSSLREQQLSMGGRLRQWRWANEGTRARQPKDAILGRCLIASVSALPTGSP
ncbi:MAG: hypothetical protein GX945_00930 [Lentisphaerae bacterium]|nr:hypothetical protein [Lentisphaerota bacterium]